MPESVPMKIIFIVFFTCCTLLFALNQKATAQCVSPSLKFANPVLVSGKGLVAGAIYKFPGITAGIDCYITLVKLNCGATLVRMETPNQGYPDSVAANYWRAGHPCRQEIVDRLGDIF